MYSEFINERIRTQLTDLQKYLKENVQGSESDKFDMMCYYREVEDENKEVCGTSACLLGWLAMSLDHTIGYDGVDLEDGITQPWRGFMDDFINTENEEARIAISQWLFAYEWQVFDNTTGGGIKRISYLLAYGVPPSFAGCFSGNGGESESSEGCYEDGYKAYSEIF